MRIPQGTIKLLTLEECKIAAMAFLERCEKGGTLNNYIVNDEIIGFKAIPKTRKFIDGSEILQIFIYVVNQKQTII